jgi:hypothetical protein
LVGAAFGLGFIIVSLIGGIASQWVCVFRLLLQRAFRC